MAHRLMIVDDSLIIRNRIARVCADRRLPAVEIIGLAADGVQALRMAAEHRPTLVTMDLTMPNMDGSECIGTLAQMLPDARILVISALSDKATALRAIQRGALGFLHKPFDDDALVGAIVEILQ